MMKWLVIAPDGKKYWFNTRREARAFAESLEHDAMLEDYSTCSIVVLK